MLIIRRSKLHYIASGVKSWLLVPLPSTFSLDVHFSFSPAVSNPQLILLFTPLASFWHRNKKFIAVQNKCCKIPPSPSAQFEARAQRPRVGRLIWSSRLFMRAAASKMADSDCSGASNICFVNFTLNSTPQTKFLMDSNSWFKQLNLDLKKSELDTFSYEPFFFLTKIDIISSLYIYLLSWITLYFVSVFELKLWQTSIKVTLMCGWPCIVIQCG